MANTALDVSENRRFQNWFWQAQRVAWLVLGALLIAALAGLTGNSGRLSHQTVGDDEFSVHYPAIMRRHTTDAFTITIAAPQAEAMLHFDSAFHDTFTVVSMTPPPAGAFATASGVAYRFSLTGAGPVTLRIAVSTDNPGWAAFTVVVDGRMALLTTLVLP